MQQIVFYKPPAGPSTNEAYLVTNNVGKHLPTAEAIGIVEGFGKVPRANSPDKPLGKAWQDSVVLVDGPCRNTP